MSIVHNLFVWLVAKKVQLNCGDFVLLRDCKFYSKVDPLAIFSQWRKVGTCCQIDFKGIPGATVAEW